MRISTKRLKRRRLKILEARQNGATWGELERKFGTSPNYLSKLLKGKDINKYCKHCGENNPEVLEKHHADKENRPDYWIWLCSNCHSQVTRKQATKRAKQKKIEQKSVLSQSPAPPKKNFEIPEQLREKLQEIVKAVTNQAQRPTTRPTQQSIAQAKPIGKAKLLHSTLRGWIDAQIWDKKYNSFIGKYKYDVAWGGDMKGRGWVEETQLREISYFDQEK